jgi:hypothetical protein
MDWIYIHPSVIIVSNLKVDIFSLGSGLNSTLQNVYLKKESKEAIWYERLVLEMAKFTCYFGKMISEER